MYCSNCKQEVDIVEVCQMCGEEATCEEVDILYCRHCNDHTIYINCCCECGEEIEQPLV